jgi:hypothetical protein
MRKESNKMVFNYFFTFRFLVVELVPCPIEPLGEPRTLHTHHDTMVKSRNQEISEIKYPILRLNQGLKPW